MKAYFGRSFDSSPLDGEVMQRNNFDVDTINLIKKAYRIIYRKGYSLEDAVKQLHALNRQANPALDTFINSIENSQRGLLR